MVNAIKVRSTLSEHRAELDFGSSRGGLQFRGRCTCGWTSPWYQRSGMVAALIGEHKASSE